MSREYVASNLRPDASGTFTEDDFLALYPQFAGIVPDAVLEMYLEQALRCIQPNRWHALWKNGISLYIAHFLTLWLKVNAPEGASPEAVAHAGSSDGAVMSKSVGGVSVSYGASEGSSDLTGWGSFKDTAFGEQFATLARMVGKGGMYVI